jgi:15-hydroxyprostaglandin dehydrogenase (NAD)
MSKPVAIVTGGASGIGETVIKHLHGKGFRVVIADLSSKAGELLAEDLGSDAIFIHTDVSDYKSQARLFKQAFEWGGNRIDLFHANAGIDDRHSLYAGEDKQELDEEGLLRPLGLTTMQVNLDAVIQGLWLFRDYVRQSKKAGGGTGHFVATSSAAGL